MPSSGSLIDASRVISVLMGRSLNAHQGTNAQVVFSINHLVAVQSESIKMNLEPARADPVLRVTSVLSQGWRDRCLVPLDLCVEKKASTLHLKNALRATTAWPGLRAEIHS